MEMYIAKYIPHKKKEIDDYYNILLKKLNEIYPCVVDVLIKIITNFINIYSDNSNNNLLICYYYYEKFFGLISITKELNYHNDKYWYIDLNFSTIKLYFKDIFLHEKYIYINHLFDIYISNKLFYNIIIFQLLFTMATNYTKPSEIYILEKAAHPL